MSIRRSLWVLAALLACLAFESIAARAATPPYDAIYVFGDSYCDVGNIYTYSGHTIPSPLYYFNGRFSNGPIWIEHVASAWGLPMYPSLDTVHKGTDFAFGGAYVTVPENIGLEIPPSIPQQVALYLSSVNGHADPKALYVIEGGGNDILGASNVLPGYLGNQIALGISASELLLRRAGAKNFLIPDLLDVGQLPAAMEKGLAFASFASAATVATNNALNLLLGFEELLEGVRIHRLDVFSLFHDIAADSTLGPPGPIPSIPPPPSVVSHFGFIDITDPCVNPITLAVCGDPDHTLFWDIEHPTEFGHAFFAVTVEAALDD